MKKIKPEVFLPPFFLFLVCIIINIADSDLFTKIVNTLNSFIVDQFGWLIILLPVLIFFVCIAIYFSGFGKVKIGGAGAKPKMSLLSWFSINICTTIACGIIFWSAAEPIQHLLHPPDSLHIEAMSPDAAKFAMSAIYTHWTVLPYAIYTLPAVMFAFGYYNKKKSFSLAAMITVLLNGREHKYLNAVIDSVCLFTLVAGLTGSLGVGVLNLSGGLHKLFGIDSTPFVWSAIMLVVIITFLVSALSGIMRGVRRLSNMNVYIYFFIIGFVLIFGGTHFICNFGVECLGDYLNHFFTKSLYTGTFAKDSWTAQWPIFYFASWMSWAPITAIFLGKIAYGRRIKDLVAMNLFSTSVFSILWFTIMSGSTIHFALNRPTSGMVEAFQSGIENTIYQLFENMPFTGVLVFIFLIAVFLSFVTAADSTVIAISDLSTHGLEKEGTESPNSIKILWAVLIAFITLIMMNVGSGVDGLKMISNIGGLPAAVFLLLVMGSAVKLMFMPHMYREEKEPPS